MEFEQNQQYLQMQQQNQPEQEESLLEKTKKIMNQLMKAQGIEIEPEQINQFPSPALSSGSYTTNSLNRFTKQDFNSLFTNETTEEQDEQQSQRLFSNYNNELVVSNKFNNELRQCTFAPLYWELQNCANQYFIYGGFCLDFTYKLEDDTALKKLNRQISHMEYFKNDGIFLLYYGTQSPTIKDLTALIKRAKSINDPQYYMLSLALEEYQKEIPQFISISKQKQLALSINQQVDQYNQNYLQFQEWALDEIKKIDSNKMFAFSIFKFNFDTLELEIQMSGQSKALMALRGVDIEDPYQYTRKETFHYLDGESNLNLLINQLSRVTQGKEIIPSMNRMITFDRLKIEINHRCMQFTNRDEAYPYKDQQLQESLFRYEFMIGVAFYDVSENTLSDLIKVRSQRSFIENYAFEDFTYSMESQIFLEKIKDQPFKKCGFVSQN